MQCNLIPLKQTLFYMQFYSCFTTGLLFAHYSAHCCAFLPTRPTCCGKMSCAPASAPSPLLRRTRLLLGWPQRFFGTALGKGRQQAKTEIERLKLNELTCRQAVVEIAKMYDAPFPPARLSALPALPALSAPHQGLGFLGLGVLGFGVLEFGSGVWLWGVRCSVKGIGCGVWGRGLECVGPLVGPLVELLSGPAPPMGIAPAGSRSDGL